MKEGGLFQINVTSVSKILLLGFGASFSSQNAAALTTTKTVTRSTAKAKPEISQIKCRNKPFCSQRKKDSGISASLENRSEFPEVGYIKTAC